MPRNSSDLSSISHVCACALTAAAAAITFADQRTEERCLTCVMLIRLAWDQLSTAATGRASHSCSGLSEPRKKIDFGTERFRKMGRNRTTQPQGRSCFFNFFI